MEWILLTSTDALMFSSTGNLSAGFCYFLWSWHWWKCQLAHKCRRRDKSVWGFCFHRNLLYNILMKKGIPDKWWQKRNWLAVNKKFSKMRKEQLCLSPAFSIWICKWCMHRICIEFCTNFDIKREFGTANNMGRRMTFGFEIYLQWQYAKEIQRMGEWVAIWYVGSRHVSTFVRNCRQSSASDAFFYIIYSNAIEINL